MATSAPSCRRGCVVAEPTVHTFDIAGRATVRVEIPAGGVGVTTWAEQRIEVEVAPARGDDRSAAAAAETRVSTAERGGRHEIVVRAPKRDSGRLGIAWGRAPELAVTVRCPEGTDLDLATQSADLEVHGRLGAVAARSASGDASLEDTEALSYTTASGDLSAGSVESALAAKSASGDVDVRSVGATASVNTVSGDVRLGDTAGPVAVKTISGDVAVAAVPGLVLWIDAQSVSGTMSSELDVGDEPSEPGQEAVELRVRTVSGDVRVARSAAAPR